VADTKNSTSVKSSTKATSKGASKKPSKKRRGAVLTILLALIFLHAIFATVLAYSTLKQDYIGSKSIILVVLALVSLADIIAAVGMWFWQKWAIYMYAITRVIATITHIILTGSTWVVFYDLLPVVILGYVINLQNKRKLFD
jgi:hypothetical protein